MASRGSPVPAPRPAAVSRGYTFASSWDQNAPLTEQQKTAVAALAQAFAERPMPSHVEEHMNGHFSDSTDESSHHSSFPTEAVLLNSHQVEEHMNGHFSDSTDESSHHSSFPTEAVLLNSHQFYQWFTDLESAMKSETEEKYQRYVNTLTEHMQTCDHILEQLDGTLHLFDDLQEQHQAVGTKTKTLHDACERLVLEKDRLVEFADALRNKLNYFDELENIATQFYSPTMNVASGHFLPLLKRLDECISYVSNNPQYADSGVYAVKFRQLQSRALSMVRTHVLGVLKTASQQVQAGVKENAAVQGKATLSEAAETSVLYVRFKSAANEIKPLMDEIESRKSKAEYSQILADCHSLYCEQRLTLVRGVVRQRISDYSKSEPLASLTRQGCAYLMQVCQSEHQLFDHFFSSSSSDTSNLVPLVDPLCTVLYDILRPKLIHEADLELLCELVEILKGEVLEEELGRRGDSVAGLKPTITRVLADVQERLTFRAQTHMRDEIANYLPSAEDLDYPAKLEREASLIANIEAEEGTEAYGALYPPLEKTLSCLSKLYRCLEPAIFTGLAQDSIGVCSSSIQKASKLIMKQSQMDGQLFLIKHLLILREQIAPFDIDFAITYKELDFAHLLEHLRRIFRGQASFFDFTSRTTFARAFSPRVTENQLDAKKDLEKTLKSTCEQFIMSITKLAVEPMLSFITKVTAVKVSVTATNRSGDMGGESRRSLKDQAFATPEKVAETVAKVDESIKNNLPTVVSKMKLYLQNPSTRSILFKPIKSNIIEAYGQINALIKDEYAVEDIAAIGLPEIAGVQAYLDGLC